MDLQTMDHFVILALMDQLRSKGVIDTAEIRDILRLAQENFVEYKEKVEAEVFKA